MPIISALESDSEPENSQVETGHGRSHVTGISCEACGESPARHTLLGRAVGDECNLAGRSQLNYARSLGSECDFKKTWMEDWQTMSGELTKLRRGPCRKRDAAVRCGFKSWPQAKNLLLIMAWREERRGGRGYKGDRFPGKFFKRV